MSQKAANKTIAPASFYLVLWRVFYGLHIQYCNHLKKTVIERRISLLPRKKAKRIGNGSWDVKI